MCIAGQIASSDQSAWVVGVERCSGIGRLDLILYCGDEAIIEEYNRIALSDKDKTSGYGDSQRKRLTKAGEKASTQIEVKGYRARPTFFCTQLTSRPLSRTVSCLPFSLVRQ